MTQKIAALLVTAMLVGCGVQPPVQPADSAKPAPPEARTSAPVTTAEETDAAIMEIHSGITSVDHQPFADPPRLVLTMEGTGWDEAAIFYGFVNDVRGVLEKMGKADLIPVGEDFLFVLRVEGSDSEWRNVLHLLVPGDAIGADSQAAAGALLQHADVDYNGRMGREVVTAFCASEKYQGRAGLMPAADFCGRATKAR